jgi:DivIVA domain-containing protein
VTWLFLLLAMSVIAVVAAVVTGRIGGGMDAPVSGLPFRGLPPDNLRPGDLETLRFSPALRGYRMDEVDQVLDRLSTELRRRDDEIARLDGQLSALQQPFGGEQFGAEQFGGEQPGFGDPSQPATAEGMPDGYEAAYQAAYGPGFATGQIPLHGAARPDRPDHDQPTSGQLDHDQLEGSELDPPEGAPGAGLWAGPGRSTPGPG